VGAINRNIWASDIRYMQLLGENPGIKMDSLWKTPGYLAAIFGRA